MNSHVVHVNNEKNPNKISKNVDSELLCRQQVILYSFIISLLLLLLFLMRKPCNPSWLLPAQS